MLGRAGEESQEKQRHQEPRQGDCEGGQWQWRGQRQARHPGGAVIVTLPRYQNTQWEQLRGSQPKT